MMVCQNITWICTQELSTGSFFMQIASNLMIHLKYQTSKGRTVYGGGGIMPDYFIPLDTGWNSKYYYYKLRNNNVVARLCIELLPEERRINSIKWSFLNFLTDF